MGLLRQRQVWLDRGAPVTPSGQSLSASGLSSSTPYSVGKVACVSLTPRRILPWKRGLCTKPESLSWPAWATGSPLDLEV